MAEDLLSQLKKNHPTSGTSTTMTMPTASPRPKSRLDNIAAEVKNLRGQNPDQKALNFFLPQEEQQAVKAEESSTVEDILDVIDNINRPMYAVAGGLKEIVKSFKDDDSIGQDIEDIGSAMKRGFLREDRFGTRDVLRELAPDLVDSIEKNTKFHLFGVDALEMDALSIPTFAGDILIDPVTYIPFGAVVEGGKGVVQTASKGLRIASEMAIGEKAVTKIITQAEEVLYKKILPMIDIKGQFSKIAKASGEGSADASDLMETFFRSKDVAESRAARTGIEVSSLGEKTGFIWNTQKLMDEEGSKKLGQAFMKADDLGQEAFQNLRAARYGTAVEDLAQFNKVEKIVDSLKLADGTDEEAAILKELDSTLGQVKGKTAKAITKMLVEERGLKRFSNSIARSERDATIEFAKSKFSTAKSLYRASSEKITGEIDGIQKVLRSDIKLTGRLVQDEVGGALKSVNELGSNYRKLLSGESPEAIQSLKEGLSEIKRKVEGLTKYQADVTKGVQGFRKSDVPLQKINTLIRNLELDIGRQQIGVIADAGGKMKNSLEATLKTLNKEFRAFQSAATSEMRGVKGIVKAGSQLSEDIVKEYRGKLGDLLRKKASLEKSFRAEAVSHEVAIRKATKYSAKAEKKYYQVFSKINSQKMNQKIMQEFWGERDKIIKGVLKDLPEELHEPFMKIRGIFDDYATKLSSGENPLLKGVNPLYFPRTVQKDMMDEVFNSIPKYRGTGKSMLRRRGFETSAEFAKYIEGQGGKVEDDAAVVLMDYMKKADMAFARHNMETELLARTGYASRKDLPREIRESLDYVYRDGATSFNNPVMEKAASLWGSAMNKVKASLTVINPAFHGRNILGFPFLSMTTAGMSAGLNPRNYADALLLKLGKEGVLKVGEKEFTYKAIREFAEESGYFGATFTRGDIKTSAKALLNRYPKSSPKRWIGEFMKLGMHSEDLGRYGALVANLRSGMDLPKAAEMARKAMFDYNLINSPVDKALQGIFGFYTFSRRNLPQQIMTMLNDPKQYAITARALNNISKREKLSDEELAALSSYEKENFKIFGEVIDGVREFTSFGFFPVEEAYQTLNTIRSGDLHKMMGSKINPVLGSFLDWYYGKNSFYGQETGNYLPSKYEAIMPEPLQKALGLTKRPKDKWRGGEKVGTENVLYGDPDTIFMIRQFPLTSRFLGDLATLAEKIQKGQGKSGAAKYLLNIRTSELDVESRKFLQDYKTQEKLKEKAKGKGAKIFERVYVPKSYKPNRLKELLRR